MNKCFIYFRFVKFINNELITGIANSPYEKFLNKCNKNRVKCKDNKEEVSIKIMLCLNSCFIFFF